jgi:hypothetical protein
MVKKFNSQKTLTKFVMVSLFIIILYTIAEFVCSLITGVFHDVLTGCMFTLFGAEIAACGFIKIFKIKKEENEC